MKQSLKANLKSILFRLVSRPGHGLPIPSQQTNLLEDFFLVLQQINFNPKHIIDVGANHGNWTKTAIKFFPEAHYSLLEPQRWLEVHVKDLLESNAKVKFYPVGAGRIKGSYKFTIMDRDDSSTFFITEKEAIKMGLEQIDVELVTLNELVADHKLSIPDVIKIDAEGLDLEVLSGASDFFGKTEIFIAEASVVSKYIKNDVYSVISYMKENGYKLFDITDLNRPFQPKVLWLVELVFIRENGFIDSQSIIEFQLPGKSD